MKSAIPARREEAPPSRSGKRESRASSGVDCAAKISERLTCVRGSSAADGRSWDEEGRVGGRGERGASGVRFASAEEPFTTRLASSGVCHRRDAARIFGMSFDLTLIANSVVGALFSWLPHAIGDAARAACCSLGQRDVPGHSCAQPR